MKILRFVAVLALAVSLPAFAGSVPSGSSRSSSSGSSPSSSSSSGSMDHDRDMDRDRDMNRDQGMDRDQDRGMQMGMNDHMMKSAEFSQKLDAGALVRVLGLANAGELKDAKMAVSRAKDQDVKDFAQHMIDDHQHLDDQLVRAIGDLKLKGQDSDLSRMMVDGDKFFDSHIASLRGDQFDRAYIDHEVEEHDKLLSLIDANLQQMGSSQAMNDMDRSDMDRSGSQAMSDADRDRSGSPIEVKTTHDSGADRSGVSMKTSNEQDSSGMSKASTSSGMDRDRDMGRDMGRDASPARMGTQSQDMQAFLQDARRVIQQHADEAHRIQARLSREPMDLSKGATIKDRNQPTPASNERSWDKSYDKSGSYDRDSGSTGTGGRSTSPSSNPSGGDKKDY